MRLTLGSLLVDELEIALRRVGSGNRLTFHTGEKQLSEWMHANALVSWIESVEPWEAEHRLITSLDVPLNLDSNGHNEFYPVLETVRSEARRRSGELPILPNPGVGGR
ncbi:hypothetical protein R4P64_33430 [Rhodococcus sp. IEGM 1366]|nr:hypothetical protein [Rhodococcus sp. IEGM 1366]MDV8071416.1 hypothetical protein [Rhodococcus sp. IEGM 1366]